MSYLQKLNSIRKCPTEFNEMFCSRCKEARIPKAREISIEPDFGIRAKGICPICKLVMNKNYKTDALSELRRIFKIVDKSCISDSDNTAENFQINTQKSNTENGTQGEQLCLQL
ncbi:MAG: hypothetical protein LBF37_02720 [Rickettsiales bacterium]|nr:hypothetical protein [Rickettsiales bacterium]